MISRAALAALAGAALLAGCNQPAAAPAQPSLQEQETARQAELVNVKGWDLMFGAPDQTVARFNQFGFRAEPYGSTGATPSFGVKSSPIMLSGTDRPQPNQASLSATGAAAGKIDSIGFTLDIADANTAPDARKRFAAMVGEFVGLYRLDAAALRAAILDERPGAIEVSGLPVTLVVAPYGAAGEQKRHLNVTINRTGASAPANSQTQGN